jgi:hypothetical protein
MTERERNDGGKFVTKGSEVRTVRSIRLTDSTWNVLEDKASEHDMSKADYFEALVNGEVEWESEDVDKTETELDFDIDEVVEILTEAIDLKANAGGKIKREIERALKLMGYEVEKK